MPIFNPPTAVAGGSTSITGDYSRGAATFFGNNGGTYTWTVPSGVTEVFVNVFGSGGRGNLAAASSNFCTGGGGGGYAGGNLTVIAGETYTITCGTGGWLSSGTTITDGTDTTFKNSAGTTLLTGGGGKGGLTAASGSVVSLVGGAGGAGTINSADSFLATYTANGGRGGNLSKNNTTGTGNMFTGGGASGSLSGDGGRGGDMFRTSGGNFGYGGTGGGGWGGGNGGDILATNTYNSSYRWSSGGGGFMNAGGTIMSNSNIDLFSSGGTPYEGGASFPGTFGNTFEAAYNSNHASAGRDVNNNYLGTRRSWWSYMTGEALTGARAFTSWSTNGDGCGGWGNPDNNNNSYFKAGVPGFGGGHGAIANYNNTSATYGYDWASGKRRIGGGGGTNMYMDSTMGTAFQQSLAVTGGDTKANLGALGRVPFGGGSGAGRSSYPFGAGDGFVVICYK